MMHGQKKTSGYVLLCGADNVIILPTKSHSSDPVVSS